MTRDYYRIIFGPCWVTNCTEGAVTQAEVTVTQLLGGPLLNPPIKMTVSVCEEHRRRLAEYEAKEATPTMADQLQAAYDDFVKRAGDPAGLTSFQVFQGGFSSAASNMRSRAMEEVSVKQANLADKDRGVVTPVLNEIKNAIGALSDVPTD